MRVDVLHVLVKIKLASDDSKDVLIKQLANKEIKLPADDDGVLYLLDLLDDQKSGAIPAVVDQLKTDGRIEDSLIEELSISPVRLLTAFRTVGDGAHAQTVDAHIIDTAIPNATTDNVNSLVKIRSWNVPAMNDAVVKKLQGESGNGGIIKEIADKPGQLYGWQMRKIREVEEVTDAVDAVYSDPVYLAKATLRYDTYHLIEIQKLDPAIKQAVLERLKGKNGLIATSDDPDHMGRLVDIWEAISETDIRAAITNKLLDNDDGSIKGLISRSDKEHLHALIDLREIDDVNMDVKTAVIDQILEIVPKMKTSTPSGRNEVHDYFEELVAVRSFTDGIAEKVDAKLLNSDNNGFTFVPTRHDIDGIVALMNLKGTDIKVKDVAEAKFEELLPMGASFDKVEALFDKADDSDTKTEVAERALTVFKSKHATPADIGAFASAINDFVQLKDLVTAKDGAVALESWDPASEKVLTSNANIYMKTEGETSVVDPDKISKLLNTTNQKAWPTIIRFAGGDDFDLSGLTNLTDTASGGPQDYITDMINTREWASKPRCVGDSDPKEQTGACIAEDEYYVDVTADATTKKTINDTLVDAITLHADDGFIGFKAATSNDQLPDRELAAKFLDLLIDDLLLAVENKPVFDLNDMTFSELLNDMQSECAEKGETECDEQQANWGFFNGIFGQLLASSQYENLDYDENMSVADALGRMPSMKQGEVNAESLKAVKTTMNKLMRFVDPGTGPGGDNDDAGDAGETASGCCGC